MAAYKRYRKDSPVSYALGITLTFEMLRFRAECARRVYIHSEFRGGDTLEELCRLCRENGIEMVRTDKIFHVLSQKENCYVIGEFQKYTAVPDREASHIVLVSPSNAGNMGTILRSSLGFGIGQMAVIRPAVDIFDPKVVRASMGAVFSAKFQYFDTFEDYLAICGERELYPFMLQAEKSVHDLRPRGTFSLLFGNEATGLGSEFLKIGTPVLIPHSPQIDSLNLPVAASIAMYEATKRQFGRGRTE